MKDITEIDGVCLPDYVVEKTNNLKNEIDKTPHILSIQKCVYVDLYQSSR